MTRLRWRLLAATTGLLLGGRAHGQTTPLATVSGRVTDPTGAPVAEATVSASSPALQGVREGRTGAAGDYVIPFLPPGEYVIFFRRDGFREARVARSLRATDTSRVDVQLALAAIAAEITARVEPPSVIGESAGTSAAYPASLVDRLPVDRSLRGPTLLAPGVVAMSGDDDFSIAGAGSYENLYLVDGVSVEDIVFGRPRPFPIEDALEESTVAVSGISAEYGRFAGGVVNVVTRSGGNDFRGSLRVTLRNEAWRSLSSYEQDALTDDPREDSVEPSYEGTLGGPLARDRLWYFLAGRELETSAAESLLYTRLPYRHRIRETRLQGKLTWSPLAGQSLRLAYGRIDTREEGFLFGGSAMDYASLSPLETPEDLLSLHYTAIARRDLFLEGQVSRRRRAPTGAGARTTDLIEGTILRDGSRGGVRWNSPSLCAVCGVPPGKLRRAEEEDRGVSLKASGLFSGSRAGAHHLIVGGEVADELRKSNSFQTGSGFTVTASSALLDEDAIRPVFLPGGSTIIEWQPILELSTGSRFRTTSAFANDSWRLGERWSFNLGLRWDADDSRDQSGRTVGRSDAWSPRLAATFAPRDGVWTIDAGFGRYLNALNFHLGDAGTAAGRPARFAYVYDGPPVNAGPGPARVPTGEALATLFDWFFANGGTSRTLRQAPRIPGLNRRVGESLEPARSDETRLGVTRRLGGRGFLRLEGVRRDFSHQASERADTSTGQVVDAGSGRRFDLRLIESHDRVERTYEALLAQVDLRVRPTLRLAGSYTLSTTRGNFDGDGSTPEADLAFYPEYGEERWRAPAGPLDGDQRQRARLWAIYELPIPERRGRLSLAALESFDSGRAWSVVGEVDPRPYVANPGYIGPPARVPYYFERRGSRRTETATATDLALHYSLPLDALRGAELFARLVVVNLFDESARTRPGETGVLTAANDPRLEPFDPFTEEPLRGVHWDLAPGFGRALSADDDQPPRSVELSFGLRF